MKYNILALFIGILIGIGILVQPIIAEDPRMNQKDWNGDPIGICEAFGDPSSKHTCQRVEIVSNQMHDLIKLEKQNNRLLAYELCDRDSTFAAHFSTSTFMAPMDRIYQCIGSVLNETSGAS